IEKMHLEQTPEVLEHKAREVLARLGYAEKPIDTGFGFDYDTNFRDSVEKEKPPPNWDDVIAGRPTMLQFWSRQSPDLLAPTEYHDILLIPGTVTEEDPPTTLSGMVNVKLDTHGRLSYLQAIAPQKDTAAAATAAPDWTPLFSAAEVDPATL